MTQRVKLRASFDMNGRKRMVLGHSATQATDLNATAVNHGGLDSAIVKDMKAAAV